jgi:Tfp pilus assembly protein PilF
MLLVLAAAAASGCSSVPLGSPGRALGLLHDPPQTDLSKPEQLARVCIVTAEGLEKEGHVREAILLYEKARATDPQAIDYARRLAVLYDLQQQPREALAEYRKALDAAPRDPDLLNDFAYFQYRQGQLSVAEDLLRQAIQLNAQHESAWTNLGIVLAQQRRYGESFQAFSQAVGAAAAHANLGAVLLKQGENEKARHELNQAVTLDPTLRQPQALLAYLDQKQES